MVVGDIAYILDTRNTKISIFGGILKFLKLIVFGLILAILGRICHIAVVESMPEARLKT